MNRDDVLNRFQAFLELHFKDGDSNTPDWRQDPYCVDLFRIFQSSAACGMPAEDLVSFVRTQWNITLQKHPTTDRARQIEELCETLSAWEMYRFCISQGKST